MKNRRLLLIIILLSSFLLSGCICRKIDLLSNYKLFGKVFDLENNNPIEGALVFFIDKGFDEHRKILNEPVKICESKFNGEVSCSYEYFWGWTEGMFKKKPTKEFVIKNEKEGYISKNLIFNANRIKRIENTYQVSIGDIGLEKER